MTIEDILKIDPNAEIENGYTTKEALERANNILKLFKVVKADKVYLDIAGFCNCDEELTLFSNEELAKIYAFVQGQWIEQNLISNEEYQAFLNIFNEMIIFQTDDKSLMEKFINDNCLSIVGGFHFYTL